jgi:hypothetical protein
MEEAGQRKIENIRFYESFVDVWKPSDVRIFSNLNKSGYRFLKDF